MSRDEKIIPQVYQFDKLITGVLYMYDMHFYFRTIVRFVIWP